MSRSDSFSTSTSSVGAIVLSLCSSDDPPFTITRLQALRARLIRNYWALFVVLVGAWFMRVVSYPVEATNWEQFRANLSVGPLVPWWAPLAYIAGFLSCAFYLIFFKRAEARELSENTAAV